MERHDAAERMVAGARQCVGVRFRLQGRGAEGMDCLGVALAALAAAGNPVRTPAHYRLSGHDGRSILAALVAAGLERLPVRRARAGDLLVQFPGLGQAHFAVRTDRGVIEAHAGAGRVVERTLGADEAWDSAWRAKPGDGPGAGIEQRAGDSADFGADEHGRSGCRPSC